VDSENARAIPELAASDPSTSSRKRKGGEWRVLFDQSPSAWPYFRVHRSRLLGESRGGIEIARLEVGADLENGVA